MPNLSLEHLLRVTLSVLVILATLLLGIGDRSAVLTVVSLVVILLSGYLTDFRGRFVLSSSAATWAALGMATLFVLHAMRVDHHGQLIAVANLQSYLQYVLFFQPKSSRVYWQLALLSLGQFAIASTLVAGPTFGIVLLTYLFVGVITFALLLLHTELQQFRRPPSAGPALAATGKGGFKVSGALELWGNSAPADLEATIWKLTRQAVAILMLTLSVTTVLFFVLPRWNVINRKIESSEPLRTVGFSKTVTLGELGEVIQNSDVVMRIQFFHGFSSRPFKLAGEPLLRGSVVSRYQEGQWSQTSASSPIPLQATVKLPLVRQHITIEPMDVPELFSVHPMFGLSPGDARLRVDAFTEQLSRQEDYRSQLLEFEVGTTSIVAGRQLAIVPSESSLDLDKSSLLQIPRGRGEKEDTFSGLRETAARVLGEKGIAAEDRVSAARALNDYLSSSGRYFYSLIAQPRDPALDPLEDFVTKHPAGHCEYFAGALVMLLRSQGIPARIAIGFKGGEWNPIGMYYQVQQLHAHAWVEVYLSPEDIPAETFDEDELPEGAWLVLDPTEGTQEGNQSGQSTSLWAQCHQYLDYAQVLWSNYVVGLNPKRQRQGIFEPLAQGASAAVESLVSPQVWRARFRALGDSPLGTFWEWYRDHWFSWRGGLVAVGFSLLMVSVYLGVHGLFWLLRQAGLVGGRRAGEAPVLEIYRRLEAALGQQGFRRQPAQTAYEFALAAGGDLAENSEHRRVAHLPRRVVESFYRVRFGGHALDNHEADAVEHALVELELALGPARKH